MTAVIIILGLVLASLGAAFYLRYRLQSLKDQGDLATAIDREFQKVTQRQQCGGLVIGVYKQGKTLIRGHGSINLENTNTPDAQSIFQIGSVSKLFTAATLQILCDEGVLSLDDHLEKLLGQQLALADAVKSITLRQLATHTSGFPRVPKVFMQRLEAKVGKQHLLDDPYSEFTTADIYAYLQNPTDLAKAGRFAYSNYGMGLLGHILEQVTGHSLETLVRAKLFQALAMQHSGIDLRQEASNQVMQGYTADCKPTPAWTFQVLAGAGAFYANATDMLQFIQANLAKDSILSRSLQKAQRPQARGKTGLAWMQASGIDRFIGNSKLIRHDGQVGGFTTYLAINPQNETGVVVLSSRSISVNMLGMMLMRQVRSQSWKN